MNSHRRWATIIVIAAVLLGLAFGLCRSPLLRVEKVIVTGPDRALAEEVARQIRVPAQTSILFYPLHRITADVRRCYRVATVAVRRLSPHVLRIEVTPRVPFAALDDGKGYTLASREGILLYRVQRPLGGLPRLTGLAAPRAPLGTQVDAERWVWVGELLAGATKAGVRDGLTVDMSDPYRIAIRTAAGVTGNLGNVNNLSRKIVVFARVVQQVAAEGGQVVSADVSTPETPLWRVK